MCHSPYSQTFRQAGTHAHTHTHKLSHPSSGSFIKTEQGLTGRKLTLNTDATYSAVTHTHTHLAVLWCVEDVHSAGFDAVGLGSSVQSEATLSAPTVSAWKRAIVAKRKRQTKKKKAQDENMSADTSTSHTD